MFKIVIDILTFMGAVAVAFATVFFLSKNAASFIPAARTAVEEVQLPSLPDPITELAGGTLNNNEPVTAREVFIGEESEAAPPKETEKSDQKATSTATKQPETTNDATVKTPAPPPLDATKLNALAREALVNILCESSNAQFKSTSGSGVIIDPRGVILTNAHIGQYVLLAEHKDVPISCVIRTKSPAEATWRAAMLLIPPAWIEAHAEDVSKLHATGTGEDDYALLLITGTLDGSPLPTTFPYVAPDTNEAVALENESVLVAGYPAEFAGSSAARQHLYASTAASNIHEVLTFGSGTVDVLSLGGTPLAQSGSSGGAVINSSGHLVGVVVTTSEGQTTGIRDLRAITLSHINRSLRAFVDTGLTAFLSSDLDTLLAAQSAQNKASQATLIKYTALGEN